MNRPNTKELISLKRISEDERKPILSFVASPRCKGQSEIKEMAAGNWWKMAKDKNYNDDSQYRKDELLLPKFKNYIEKERKEFSTTRNFIQNTGTAASDVISLPKLEDKKVENETKRRGTPFASSKKYEIKKWLNDMFQIQEEQCKMNDDDHQAEKQHTPSRLGSKILTRRRSMLNLPEMSDGSRELHNERNGELQISRRHSTGKQSTHPKLHKIHSDSNIKYYLSSCNNFDQERKPTSVVSSTSNTIFTM